MGRLLAGSEGEGFDVGEEDGVGACSCCGSRKEDQ